MKALRTLQLCALACLLLASARCTARPDEQAAAASSAATSAATSAASSAAPVAGLPDGPCVPTDQDAYVFRPARLQLVQPCVRAAGTVAEITTASEVDGDMHIHLRLDAPYLGLLAPGNQDLGGSLVVEAVCQITPPQIEALRICASDPDPYLGPFPRAGDHIWVEGRYVLDLWHHSWAELHPLYRWGVLRP